MTGTWWWEILTLLLASACGFAAGHLSIVLNRRHEMKEAEKGRGARWRIVPFGANTYRLKNIGEERATGIKILGEGAPLFDPRSDFTLDPGEAEPFTLTAGRNPHLVITWVSHRGEPMGPIKMAIGRD